MSLNFNKKLGIYIGVLISILFIFYKCKLNTLLPIKKVQIFAPMKYVTERELRDNIEPIINNIGFFNINMDNLEHAIYNNKWTKNIRIARVWPDTVRISFEEKNPLAYWNNKGIITDQDCDFISSISYDINMLLNKNNKKSDINYVKNLPHVFGEKKNSKKLCDTLEKLVFYTKTIDISVKNIYISKRGAWYLELDNGVYVLIGKTNILERINKFVSLYTSKHFIGAKDKAMNLDEIKYFDLRYQNGIAVGNRFTDTINVIRETA